MTMQYKVWLEVEEIDEARNHYQNIDLPFAGLATFDSREAAVSFAESVQHQFKPPAKDAIHITWSVEDVTEIRPDLTFPQAMAVLRRAAIHHDATIILRNVKT